MEKFDKGKTTLWIIQFLAPFLCGYYIESITPELYAFIFFILAWFIHVICLGLLDKKTQDATLEKVFKNMDDLGVESVNINKIKKETDYEKEL